MSEVTLFSSGVWGWGLGCEISGVWCWGLGVSGVGFQVSGLKLWYKFQLLREMWVRDAGAKRVFGLTRALCRRASALLSYPPPPQDHHGILGMCLL